LKPRILKTTGMGAEARTAACDGQFVFIRSPRQSLAKPGVHPWFNRHHLLSAPALLKLPCAQRRRHLEKSQLAGPAVFDRRAVRD
jgi:hypothetical protein